MLIINIIIIIIKNHSLFTPHLLLLPSGLYILAKEIE